MKTVEPNQAKTFYGHDSTEYDLKSMFSNLHLTAHGETHLDGEVVEIHPHTWLGLRGQGLKAYD